MGARLSSPRFVALALSAICGLSCVAAPRSPRVLDPPQKAQHEEAPAEDRAAASPTAETAPPAASGSAAPRPALAARPGKIAFVTELLEHAEARALSALPDGSVFVVGETTWGYSFKNDLFLARLEKSGAEAFFEEGIGRNVRDVVNTGADVYLSTELLGAVHLGGKTIPTVSGATDLFIGKTDLQGKLAWGTIIGTPSYDRGAHLAPTADGGVVVAHGAFASAKTGPVVFTPAGAQDTLVSRFDQDGNKRWTRSFGASGYDEPNAILVDPSGDVFVAGTRWRSRNEWASGLASTVCEGFLLRLSPEGELRWSVGIGGYAGHTSLRSVALASNGDVLVRGLGMWDVRIGDLAFTSKTEDEIFARIDPKGTILAARHAPATECNVAHPSGASVGATTKGIFHEDEHGKRTPLFAFESSGIRVFACALAGEGRFYFSGRIPPEDALGGASLAPPRHVRGTTTLPSWSRGFVAGLDL